MKKFALIQWIGIATWLGIWLWYTRYAMLDDALIHLRYASNLHDFHRITYDGVTPTYGTSSLFYVMLLAFLVGFFHGPLVSKSVSVVAYLLLVMLLIALGYRSRRFETRMMWTLVLFVALVPMAVRWLSDGMETSLVVLATVLFAVAAHRFAHASKVSLIGWLGMACIGLLLVLIRIELALLAFLVTCAIFAVRYAGRNVRTSLVGVAFASSPALAGAAVAAVGVQLTFGNLLPDTAVAKSSSASIGNLASVIHVLVSSFAFGCGSALIAAFSAWLCWRSIRSEEHVRGAFAAWLIANSGFPIVVALICIRGQSVQGVRYVLWPLFFAIAWNLLTFDRSSRELSMSLPQPLYFRPLAGALATLLVLMLPVDWHYAAHAMTGRANTFLAMRGAGLERYRGRRVVAGDIGFIGYFSKGQVCDLDGLVNGRAVAALPPVRRAQICASENPDLLFLTDDQKLKLAPWLNFAQWTPVQTFDFVNVGSNDRHVLFVSRAE